jgi:hypothetical protein
VTIGAIDPDQRRVAQRLVLGALRRFHREQPLFVDLRIDTLVSRVRAAAGRKPPPRHRGATPLTLNDADLRRVIDEMADDGRLVRNGRRVGLPGSVPGLDPEMAERVDRLLEGLRSAGASPPRVDGPAARLGIPPTVLDQLRAGGVLRRIAPGIDYPADVWSALLARLEAMSGQLSVARVRDELHTSRRHAEALMAAMGDRGASARAHRHRSCDRLGRRPQRADESEHPV